MKAFLHIELTTVNRQVVVVLDGCGAETAEAMAQKVRALDPDAKEIWRIEPNSSSSCDDLIFVSAPNAMAIMRHIREYVGIEKSRAKLNGSTQPRVR
jgi:hypothetical protein